MESNKKVWVLVLAIVALVLVWMIWTLFATGNVYAIIAGFQKLLFWSIILGIIGGIIYLVFFYKRLRDANAENLDNIRKECLMNHNKNLKRFWSTGDSEHVPKCFGRIIGYVNKKNIKLDENQEYINEHIFLVQTYRDRLFDKLISHFRSGEIFRIPGGFIDELHGDVYVKTNSFVRHVRFWFPSQVHLDYDFVNKSLYNEANRMVQADYVGYLPRQLNKASGVNLKDEMSIKEVKGTDLISGFKKKFSGDNNE